MAGIKDRHGLLRIERLRLVVCWDHARQAIVAGNDSAKITVSRGELRAMQHMVDFYVAHGLEKDHLRHVARSLAADSQARASSTGAVVPLWSAAREYARRSGG